MARFRKKPVVVEAIQWKGDNTDELHAWLRTLSVNEGTELNVNVGGAHILTLEGDMTASLGDWIICGVKGELYPCKPDIFETTYESVDP